MPSLWRGQADPSVPFTVCAMFTPGYLEKAERLETSLKALGLPYALYQVPSVHRSISDKGSDDPAFSKPRMIEYMLEQAGRPILYVDADMVFRQRPGLVWALAEENADFAVYNWLVDRCNDTWRPAGAPPPPGMAPRFWRFHFAMDISSTDQLFCSGAVQYWAPSKAASQLRKNWIAALSQFPRSEDDQCLDYAFNFRADKSAIKHRWFPKEYVRYGFWPYARPVIDHPEIPGALPGHFEQLDMRRADAARLMAVEKEQAFPREAILDAVDNLLLVPRTDGYVPAGPLPRPLYL